MADARKRIHAALHAVHHDQSQAASSSSSSAGLSAEDERYLAYINDTYGVDEDETPRAAAAAAATPKQSVPRVKRQNGHSDAPLLEVGLKEGEQRISIEPLDQPDERRLIPREDGYLPRRDGRRGIEYASEGPYGVHYMDEVRRRQEMLEAHPSYQFLTLMAGAAGVPLTRIINIEHLESRAVREEGRQRINELEKKIAEQNLSQLVRNRDELERRLTDLSGGVQAVQYSEALAQRRALLENEAGQDVSALSDVDIRRRKYRQLQTFLVNWVHVAHDGDNESAEEKNESHRVWMDEFFDVDGDRNEADRALLKNWLYGAEFGAASARLLVPFRQLIEQLVTKAGAGGTILLRDNDFNTLGQQLLDLLEELASLTYNARGQLDTDRHRAGMATMPVFDFSASSALHALSQPALIGKRIEELDERIIDLEEQIAQSLDAAVRHRKQQELENAHRLLDSEKARLAATAREATLPAALVQQLRLAFNALQSYTNWQPTERVSRQRFLELFGTQLTPVQRESVLLAQMLQHLDRTEQDIRQRQARREAELASNEQARTVLQRALRDLETLRRKVQDGQRAVQAARTELETLQQRFYQHRYEWTQQPINSGLVALDESTVRALNQACSLVRSAMQLPSGGDKGDNFLDALMQGDVKGDFAELAAVCFKIGYSTTGRAYTDRQILGINNATLNALMTHFRENIHLGLNGKLIRAPPTASSLSVRTDVGMQQLYDLQREFYRQPEPQGVTLVQAALDSRRAASNNAWW